MDATTGDVAGASVQIGDPITEKLLIDVLAGAERSVHGDHRLRRRRAVVGDRRDGRGRRRRRRPRRRAAQVPRPRAVGDLASARRRSGWSLAVAPDRLDELRARVRPPRRRADRPRRVHRRRPARRPRRRRCRARPRHRVPPRRPPAAADGGRLPAPDRSRRRPPRRRPGRRRCSPCSPTRTSPRKAAIIHRYDHEIRGATRRAPARRRRRPTGPPTASCSPTRRTPTASPSASASTRGTGCTTPSAMAARVVDEAIRNVVAVGADPDRVALLDNFSWGDPRDAGDARRARRRRRRLLRRRRSPTAPRSVAARTRSTTSTSAPTAQRHAVPPTLVITAVAHVPDAERVRHARAAARRQRARARRRTPASFGGSHLDLLTASTAPPAGAGIAPQPDPAAPARYRALHRRSAAASCASCHDVSEGGLAVAVAEMCIAGRLGVADRRARPRRRHRRAVRRDRPAASSSRSPPDDARRARRHALARRRPTCSATVTAEPDAATSSTVATIAGRRPLAAAFDRGDGR